MDCLVPHKIITSRPLPTVSSPSIESEGKLPKRALEEREEGGRQNGSKARLRACEKGGKQVRKKLKQWLSFLFFIVLFARSASANIAFSLFELIDSEAVRLLYFSFRTPAFPYGARVKKISAKQARKGWEGKKRENEGGWKEQRENSSKKEHLYKNSCNEECQCPLVRGGRHRC